MTPGTASENCPHARLWPKIGERNRLPELMDEPDVDPQQHRLALKGLARINSWSGAHRALWKHVRSALQAVGPSEGGKPQQLSLVDVACGSGDLLIGLAERAKQNQLELQLFGCDFSETAIAAGAERARTANVPVGFFQADALAGQLQMPSLGAEPQTKWNVVTSSLFLHHLDHDDAIALMRTMMASASQRMIICDLRRTRRGHLLAWFGTRILSRSPIVHYDGPVSVQGAWTMHEAVGLAKEAGWQNIEICKQFPQRFVLQGTP